jgi:lipopolysaccharide export system ATP-binding protein
MVELTKPCLSVNNIQKRYGKKIVLRDISFSVEKGQVVGLLGPNGAGKTTSFYVCVGLVQGDAGNVTLNGEDISKLPMHKRARKGVGYLPQENSIFRKLTVAQNILAVLELRSELSKLQRITKKNELLQEFNISHIEHSLGMALSGGERRRVEIARCLAADPDFVLLDEPFAGVDPISVNDIKSIIRHLKNRGIGVLITDHNVRETLDICEYAYIVSEGHILAQGSSEDVLANQMVRDVYLGQDFRL